MIIKLFYLITLSSLLIINLNYLIINNYIYVNAEKSNRYLKILSICTDMEDLIYTYKLINYIYEYGYSIYYEIVFLNKFSSEASIHMNKLRDTWFLRGFDQIWIFDYNIEFSISSLSYSELSTVERVLNEGRVLIIGSRTYIDNYSDSLSKITGVDYISSENNGVFSINYMNKTYSYNSTLTKYLIIRNREGFIKGYFEPLNYPAVVYNKYGSGVSILLAFNPVEQAVRYGNLDMYRIVSEIVIDSIKYLGERREPPLFEKIYYTLFLSINIYNIAFYTFLVFITLEITSCLGILPYRLVKIFVKPIVLIRIICRSSYSEYVEIIAKNPDLTIYELANRLGVSVNKVKVVLAILEFRKVVESRRETSGKLVFRIKQTYS